MVLQVSGRSSDRHAQLRPDRHCDHDFVDGVAQAYSRIETVGHDVPESVVDIEFDVDVGVVRRSHKTNRWSLASTTIGQGFDDPTVLDDTALAAVAESLQLGLQVAQVGNAQANLLQLPLHFAVDC